MIMILVSMSVIGSITLMFLSHPMSMGLNLLIQTIVIALTMRLFNLNFWYSYIMSLIMVGGMLVLFIYMTSIASNEKFKFSIKIFLLMLILSLIMLILFFFLDLYMVNINNSYKEQLIENYNNYSMSLNKFLTYPMLNILLLMIIYLFITLIAVVKITDINQGPLRQMN